MFSIVSDGVESAGTVLAGYFQIFLKISGCVWVDSTIPNPVFAEGVMIAWYITAFVCQASTRWCRVMIREICNSV